MRDDRKSRWAPQSQGASFDGGYGASRRVDPYAKEPFWNLTRIACLVIALAVATPFVFPDWFREPVEQGEGR